MKIILLAVVGFGVGSAGGVYVVSRRPVPPAEETVPSDPVAASAVIASIESQPDSVVSADDSTPTPDPVITLVEPAAIDAVVEAPVIPAGPLPEEILAAQQSVARILGTMKPDEAAQVVGAMNDDEAEVVLRNLGTRKAALLLASLPRERAASLARRLMVPGGSQ